MNIIPSSKYKKGSLYITPHKTLPGYCYVWSRIGRIEKTYYRVACKACRALKDANKDDYPTLRSIKISIENDRILESECEKYENYVHFCSKSFTLNEMIGLGIRREQMIDLSEGSDTPVGMAIKKIAAKVTRRDADDYDKEQMLAGAIGVKENTRRAFHRAKASHFPVVDSYQDLNANHPKLHYSLKGLNANEGSRHYQEWQILAIHENMVIFTTPRLLRLLSKSREIVCDGTFKYAPKESSQIYRVFGFVQGKSFPFVTALMNYKTMAEYTILWQEIKKALLNEFNICYAHFDYEEAAVKTFQKEFPTIQPKMCCFHVKQCLDKRIKSMRIYKEYQENDKFQKVVRMIGSLQFVPENLIAKSIQVIKAVIDANFTTRKLKTDLKKLLDYYENVWIKNKISFQFFTLFRFRGQRTTNSAEYYHGTQRHFYRSTNLPLGQWIDTYRIVTNEEEYQAYEIYKGRQSPKVRKRNPQLDQRIEDLQEEFNFFFSQNPNEEQATRAIRRYLAQMGCYIGIEPKKMKDPNSTVNRSDAGIGDDGKLKSRQSRKRNDQDKGVDGKPKSKKSRTRNDENKENEEEEDQSEHEAEDEADSEMEDEHEDEEELEEEDESEEEEESAEQFIHIDISDDLQQISGQQSSIFTMDSVQTQPGTSRHTIEEGDSFGSVIAKSIQFLNSP